MAKKKTSKNKTVETLPHDADKRTNIPTAEYQPIVQKEHVTPVRVAYERRNRDLDPQLVWRGKDEQDWSDLVVHAPPLCIQEKVRVAGPFTVESLSPHRILGVDENDDLIDPRRRDRQGDAESFGEMILENLKAAGVQQAHKEDRITFTSLVPWPGDMVCAEGIFRQDAQEVQDKKNEKRPAEAKAQSSANPVDPVKEPVEKRAAVFIGPEFGTVQRQDLVQAAREAGDAGFDVLIACWFVDTNYNDESFFVRHAYVLGASDPCKSLKTTLKSEIDAEAWASLNSDTSRPFDKPESGRIAVKVINHLGDEVMKFFRV